MGQLFKTVGLLVGAQLLCLGLGLWLHDRFIVSAARWEAGEQTFDRLSATAETLASQLIASAENAARLELPPDAAAVTLDGQGQVTWASAGGEQLRGTALRWRPRANAASSSGPAVGELLLPQGPRQAVGVTLESSGSRLLVYSTSPPAIGGAQILGVLPAAGAIAGLWIGGLQAIVAYLIVSRLHTRRMRDQAKADAETLRRSRELVRTRDAIIFGLAKLAESRDADTGHHLERISLYSTRLAAELRRSAKYRGKISPSFVRLIGISSALHDIGKVGIRDAVLLKSGKLNAAEFKHIQTHTAIGGDCLRLIERRLGESNFLEMAREIALHHHERWDGRGYPSGLAGEQIPLAARIVAIADVYDALSQKRCYRDPLPHEACVDFIRENAGAHFDPELVEVFLRVAPQFREIARQYAAHREALTTPSETPGEPALAGAAGIGN